ncbi:hypothetical protein GF324_10660 [bacterium]|nr:hypothetical protein [bacterium]
MLLEYSVKNWLSFRDETKVSFVATNERQHNDRLARVKKFQLRILPTAAFYGGNASGKSNLFKSIHFAR